MMTFLSSLLAGGAVMFAGWLYGTLRRDLSWLDPGWGPAFVASAVAGAIAGPAESTADYLLVGAVAIWGLRLGGHLVRRKRSHLQEEDRRYAAIRERRGNLIVPYSFVMLFLVQWASVAIVSLPIPLAMDRTGGAAWLIAPGLVLWLIGVLYEAIGDAQLEAFKADPGNRGKILDTGLWATTRHPNYFGDACMWWGVGLLALAGGAPIWTLVGPLFMTVLIYKGSGVALLDRDMAARKPGYRDYMQRVPAFVPNPLLLGRSGK